MNSVKIGTYQMDTAFGLYLPEYTIPAPAPQTKFVKIIGRDGSVDLSDAIGLHYDSRSWSLDFKCFDPTVNWHTLTSSVMNAIHGKRLNFEFDDDPDYYWTGRISVSSYVSSKGTGTLKVNITSDPFKYAKLSTIVTKTASTGTEYTGSMVTFNGGLVYDLSADIEPTQDLHGYANPWPAGGGKNKIDQSKTHQQGANQLTLGQEVIYTTRGIFLTAGTYTISVVLSGGKTATIYLRTDSDTDGSSIGNTTAARSFTLESDTHVAITLYTGNGITASDLVSVQLESGSSATAWTPYSNICPISGLTGLSVYVSPTQDPDDATTYSVDWSTQAGTVYGGTVDVVTGVLTVNKVSVDLGSLIWTHNTSYSYPFFTADLANRKTGYVTDEDTGALCSVYQVINAKSTSNFRSNAYDFCLNLPTGTGTSVMVQNSQYTDATAFKTAMSGEQLVYELATPLTYQLTPQEIQALVGTNNVWSSSGDVSVTVVIPKTVTNNGLPTVPTVTASADMVLRWGNYSASVQQGTSTIPQLVLDTGDNHICIIGTGNISFEWSEASL